MIAVGHSRDAAGRPSVIEKAAPDSEIRFYQNGPSLIDQMLASNGRMFIDGPEADLCATERIYSHSTADLR